MHVERLTNPTAKPFDERDLEDHLRITADDRYEARSHASAAAEELQHYASLALLTQSIRVTVPAWPAHGVLSLPIAPVVQGASVTVADEAGAFTEFVLVPGLRPALRLTGTPPSGEIVVTYDAGFGDDWTAVPPDLRLAILDQAAATFDARGPSDGKTNGMSAHMARIAARYRRVAL